MNFFNLNKILFNLKNIYLIHLFLLNYLLNWVLNSLEFKYLVDSIRIVEKALGSEIKKATRIEKKNMICVRKSIVAKINIAKGEKFTKNNITFKRPGNGISPMLYKKIIGKKSKFNFFKDDLLKLNYLEKNKIKCY